ncbi:uncharacterized protein N7498_002963 [Penicillium cinerascens]|uniref:DUF7136 domain-containing protein n=1 Tax=Penicillium cinerascens TaxID=70096 RepID=A0A9W9NB36_9EURO|nr:uncharacterized protein N7498_002963 [Penicillium cinerascens]KAJ5216556.1 hypothetical protein N7498_002963 [Penicillium cinerascens]
MIFFDRLSYLCWCLLPLLLATNAQQTSGFVEVDLIFPHNESYTTSDLMPFVFAIQNPQLAIWLNPSLEVFISRWDSDRNLQIFPWFLELWKMQQEIRPDPYLIYTSLGNMTSIDAIYKLEWILTTLSCSGSAADGSLNFTQVTQNKTLWFSTKNGAQPLDLVAATKHDTCAANESLNFDISGLEKVPSNDLGNLTYSPSCPVLANVSLPSVTPTPCAVTINSTAASSITAALSYSACIDQVPDVSTCGPPPAQTPTASTNAGRTWLKPRTREPVWLAGGLAWLVYLLG